MSEHRIGIAPSILSADFARLGDAIRLVEDAGADMIHVDVMDGHFVPNITMGPVVVSAIRSVTGLPIDAHLMISDPAAYAVPFIRAGADYVVFHAEACNDASGVIELIRAEGARPGLAVNPANPAEKILPHLPEIDLALIMTVNPGFSGQSFMQEVMPKLKQISDWKALHDLEFIIEVDGGIGPATAPTVARNGGEMLVAASAIFNADDPAAALSELRAAAEAGLQGV